MASLLPGMAAGHQQQLVEPQGGDRGLAQCQMADVDRVEAAAEQADAGAQVPAHSQSRAGRKSVNRRASGVPGSGWYW